MSSGRRGSPVCSTPKWRCLCAESVEAAEARMRQLATQDERSALLQSLTASSTPLLPLK
jgi:hypothetical protein